MCVCVCWCTETHGTAQNGFVHGADAGPRQRRDSDVYPEEGPLQSGTHSLKRVKPSKQTKVRNRKNSNNNNLYLSINCVTS